MAENTTLSAGTGDGDRMRTLPDSTGTKWPTAAVSFATTLADNANVLSVVTPTNPLPVAATLVGTVVVDAIASPVEVVQGTAANLKVLATIDGDITVGTITGITNPVSVVNATAANLLTTASQGGSWTVAATQSGTWNVGVTGTIAATQSGTWTANQGGSWTMAATQSGTWNVATVSTVTAVTTVGAVTSITNPVATTQSGTWNVGVTGTVAATQSGTWNVAAVTSITNPVASTQSGTWTSTVTQPTAANLNATVSIAAAQTLATVTNVTTVGTITNPVGLAAGSNLIGKASVGSDTSTIYNGATAITPKFAKITASSSGDNSVVAAVAGKKIRVLRWSLSANGTVSAKWRSATTDVTGLHYLVQYGSAGGSYCPIGVFETAVGEALQLNLSGAIATGGEISYVEV